MGKILLGFIIALLILVLGGLGFATLGFFPTSANVEPPHWETHLAMSAVDASMERPLSRRPRSQAVNFLGFLLSSATKSRLRSTRRSRVAHFLHNSHRSPLYRNARLG
jgi:hypothetical protein